MSNQRISDLRRLTKEELSQFDLLLVTDVDEITSATGETKKTTIQDLSAVINPTEKVVYDIIIQENHGFYCGQVVRLDKISKKYKLASCETDENSEAIGVIRKIIDEDKFELVFNGIIEFDNDDIYNITNFIEGEVYFLSNILGALSNIDPSEINSDYISKPILVALTEKSAVITNYRGFYRPGSDEFTVTTLSVTGSNSFVIGDVLRKTNSNETASLGQWTLASADSLHSTRVVGVVTERSDGFFKLTTTGIIKNLNNISIGEIYYLNTSSSFDTLDSTQRNVTKITDGINFIKPIYVGISNSEAVLLNQLTTEISKNSIGTTGTVYGPFPYITSTRPTDDQYISFVTTLLPNAIIGDGAIVYWMVDYEKETGNKNVFVKKILELTEFGWGII